VDEGIHQSIVEIVGYIVHCCSFVRQKSIERIIVNGVKREREYNAGEPVKLQSIPEIFN
jgi:hypothetical protein